MTDKLIKEAPTGQGWAIGLIQKTAYSTGKPYWSVIRINPKREYLALSSHYNLTEARAAANEEWKHDRDATTGSAA